ncbi:hypothetical protein [Nocardia bovistercoris]|uniref:Uncharacterized protein n=1 Tax=Nocardia bovistercoris TaxID=2785916 RepID=A0A931N4K0_9NOCA|nr:hypothetical protein [Nocardia bovistercoris]MBH0778341.1 hypothetical protein [Nocardia bovistercoris]
MRQGIAVALGEAVIVVLCLIGAVASWGNGTVHTSFAPNGDLPAFEATRYIAPWLVLSVFLVTVAGLCAMDAAARVGRAVSRDRIGGR